MDTTAPTRTDGRELDSVVQCAVSCRVLGALPAYKGCELSNVAMPSSALAASTNWRSAAQTAS